MDNDHEEKIKSNTHQKIHGWLTLFLWILRINALGGVIYSVIAFSFADYDTGQGLFMALLGYIVAIINALTGSILAAYTVYSFYSYRHNAVTLGKIHLILVFIENLLILIVGYFEEGNVGGIGSDNRAIAGITSSGIWFAYLCLSKQVNELFPKEKRTLYKRDKYLFWIIIGVPCLYLLLIAGYAIKGGIDTAIQEQYLIEESTLKSYEYTDGMIAFKAPSGFSVEKQTVYEQTCFVILKDYDISIIMSSASDGWDTQNYFDEMMTACIPKSFKEFEYEVENEYHHVEKENSIYMRKCKYLAGPEWTFFLIFNKATSKCCFISCYNVEGVESDNYYYEIINSIRFK